VDVIEPMTRSWQDAARPGARLGHRIEAHAEIGSTNDRARELLEVGDADGVAVVAELQTAGRGRMGRTWTSPAGHNVTVSVGLRPAMAADEVWQLTLAAALAVHAACARVAPVRLKWPNDLVAPDGAKVAGMLVEAASEADRLLHAVVGVGINVNWAPEAMPADLAANATSLSALAGRSVDRVALLGDLLTALDAEVAGVEAGRSPLDRYRAACATLGANVVVETPSGRIEGVAAALDDRGALVVRTPGGTDVPVTSGEVLRVRPAVAP
jgi:BirA family biotin operon repressor/biotin-[acetyl-CoA-carboxylase] ligase